MYTGYIAWAKISFTYNVIRIHHDSEVLTVLQLYITAKLKNK